jgi:adenylyltransferase/sulfurtransferase
VGRLGLVDFDVVDFTNLQRQVAFGTSDVGRKKLDAAKDRLANLNPNIQIDTHEVLLSSSNALDILREYDIVVDGQASIFGAPGGPCYRCLYPEPPPPGLVPSCAEGGVLGVLPGIVGSLQAIETIKLIIGKGRTLVGRLLLFDALEMRFRELKLRKNRDCPLCGEHPTITALIDYQEFCGLRGQEAQPRMDVPEITPRQLKDRLDRGDDLYILDVREPHEFQICNLNGHLIPLGDLPRRVNELDTAREIVAHCRSGKRSADAVAFLQQAGFKKIWNLKGGILAWSDEVDPRVPKY